MSVGYVPTSGDVVVINHPAPSKGEIIRSILIDQNFISPFTICSILFDEDSILFNDDEEDL